jgi:ankyrin repeat protein
MLNRHSDCGIAPGGLWQRAGITTQISAASNGETAAIRALIAAGADPGLPGGVNGWPPLMHAIHKNQKAAALCEE